MLPPLALLSMMVGCLTGGEGDLFLVGERCPVGDMLPVAAGEPSEDGSTPAASACCGPSWAPIRHATGAGEALLLDEAEAQRGEPVELFGTSVYADCSEILMWPSVGRRDEGAELVGVMGPFRLGLSACPRGSRAVQSSPSSESALPLSGASSAIWRMFGRLRRTGQRAIVKSQGQVGRIRSVDPKGRIERACRSRGRLLRGTKTPVVHRRRACRPDELNGKKEGASARSRWTSADARDGGCCSGHVIGCTKCPFFRTPMTFARKARRTAMGRRGGGTDWVQGPFARVGRRDGEHARGSGAMQ